MKIIYLASPIFGTNGGALTVTKSIISGLKNDEHIYIGNCKYMRGAFQELGHKTYRSNPGFEPVTIFNLLLSPISFILGIFTLIKYYRLFKEADLIVNATGFCEVFYIIPWLILMRKKTITINHTNKCPRALLLNPLRPLLQWVFNRQNVVFVSDAHLYEWRQKGLVGKYPYVINNGVTLTKFENKVASKNELNIGFIGRIHQEKGIVDILEALKIVETDKKLNVFIAGDGDIREGLMESYSNDKYADNININWLGFQKNPDAFYPGMDLVLFPSYLESFGLVLIEAWCYGIPVITSDIPSLVDIKSKLPNSIDKLIINTGDVIGMKKAIEKVIQKKLYQRNRVYHEIVKNNFSTKIMVKNYDFLFKYIQNSNTISNPKK